MVVPLNPPLMPRRGVTPIVLGICRISTLNQDPRSLEDQEALLRRYVADHYDGPVSIQIISSQGSGEYLDRSELTEAEDRIQSGAIDLVIAEDLARICRRNYAVTFCELAEDHDTRLIAINDQIDTGGDGWRMNAMFSAFKHEASNKDTALRIRRTMRHRFSQGGIVQTTIFGYCKPPGTKSDAELRKDPSAEPIYEEMFRRLEDGATFAEVADWLNDRGIKPGPYARSGRWTSPWSPAPCAIRSSRAFASETKRCPGEPTRPGGAARSTLLPRSSWNVSAPTWCSSGRRGSTA